MKGVALSRSFMRYLKIGYIGIARKFIVDVESAFY